MKVSLAGTYLVIAAVLSMGAIGPLLSQEGKANESVSGEGASVLNDSKLLAQKTAIRDLSGNDAFVLRQTWWKGSIKPGQAKLIQIQLFKRNEYRFWYAVPGRDATVRVHVYNGKGDLVKTESTKYPVNNVASTMISVDATGLYFVRIFLSNGIEAPQDWALIYGYR